MRISDAASSRFSARPHVILEPDIRWYPGDDQIGDLGLMHLLPPLVHAIRREVKAWRDSSYAGASRTTRALLRWWFQVEHAPSRISQGYVDGRKAPGVVIVFL